MKFLKKEYTIKKTVGGVLLDAIVCSIVVGIIVYLCTNNVDFINLFKALSTNKKLSMMLTFTFSIFFCIVYLLAEFASYIGQNKKAKTEKK